MPAFQPKFQGDEDPRISKIDEASELVILKLRVMSRANVNDKARYRQELRELLQDYVNKAMAFADAVMH
jgi:hypothetical protein